MRCSGLPVFWQCPSSQLPCEHPYNPESDAAALGKAVHEALAMMVTGPPYPDLATLAGKHDVELDELSRLYATGRDAWERLERYLAPGSETKTEQRLEMRGMPFTGTADVLTLTQTQLVCVDWKSGRIRTDVRAQVLGYLCIARALHGPRDVYRCVVAWLQYDDIETHDFTDGDLNAFMANYHDKVRDIGKAYAPGAACRYCQRQLVCKAKQEFVQSTALAVSDCIRYGKKLFTPERMGEVYERVKLLEKAIEQFKDAVKLHVAEHGGLDLPNGKRLVERHYQRNIYDPRASWKVLTQKHGFSADEMAQVMSVSATAVKRLIGQKVGQGEKGHAQQAALQDIQDEQGIRSVSYSKMVQVKGE